MRPTNEQVLDAYDLAIVAVDGVIRLAEADQRTNSAVDWGYIATNPAKGKITMPRIPQSRAAAFSERDEEKLLAWVRSER